MTKKLLTIKCPTCGAKITKDDLGYAQQGTQFYKVSFDKNGEPDYETDEFVADDGGEFYHSDCGGRGIDNDDVRSLGVKY